MIIVGTVCDIERSNGYCAGVIASSLADETFVVFQ
jgi:hypothetical protein